MTFNYGEKQQTRGVEVVSSVKKKGEMMLLNLSICTRIKKGIELVYVQPSREFGRCLFDRIMRVPSSI